MRFLRLEAPIPDHSDSEDMALRAKNGDRKAMEECVKKFRPMAKMFARKCHMAAASEDVEQVSMVAVMSAVRTWDPEKGSFSGHVWRHMWGNSIRERMWQRAFGGVGRPNKRFQKVLTLRDKGWTQDAIAREMATDRLDVHLRENAFRVKSLDSPVGYGLEPETFVQMLEDPNQEDPFLELEIGELEKAFFELSDFDQIVLKLRFWDENTLDEIGEEFGLSRERIRQVEARALDRLREIVLFGGARRVTHKAGRSR
jgi:RNA polymerase primary sigma factor